MRPFTPLLALTWSLSLCAAGGCGNVVGDPPAASGGTSNVAGSAGHGGSSGGSSSGGGMPAGAGDGGSGDSTGTAGAAGEAGLEVCLDSNVSGELAGEPFQTPEGEVWSFTYPGDPAWTSFAVGKEYSAFAWGEGNTPLPHGIGHVVGPGGAQFCATASADRPVTTSFVGKIHYGALSYVGACDSVSGPEYKLTACLSDQPGDDCPENVFRVRGVLSAGSIDTLVSPGATLFSLDGDSFVQLTSILPGVGYIDARAPGLTGEPGSGGAGSARLLLNGVDLAYCVTSAALEQSGSVWRATLTLVELGTCPGVASTGYADTCTEL